MNIVYLGSGSFGIDSLDALLGSGHSLVHIFTQPSLPAGRGKKLRKTPVAQWAESNDVPYDETDNINCAEMLQKVAECKADVVVVAAFGQKIGQQLIDSFSRKVINIHASLLPAYRGAAPINWAIIKGEKVTGVSIITIAAKMDAGEILSQEQIEITPADTTETLHEKLAKLAAPLLIKTIEQIGAGTAEYRAQDPALVSQAPKLKKADGLIDWSQSAEAINNKIRGLWPWPGAQGVYRPQVISISNKKSKECQVMIAKAQVVGSADSQVEPGTLDEGLNVVCGSGALKIIKIKPAGSSLMDFSAFVNGRHTQPGDKFVSIAE